MAKLTHADVQALEGWDVRTPILVLTSLAALGLCWLFSRLTPLPLGDLLFVLGVSGYAAFEMHRAGGKAEEAEEASLPLPSAAGTGAGGAVVGGFGGFLRRRHELLGLITQRDRRVRAMALGVGALVMLLWRLFAQLGSGPTTSASGRFQVGGWICTLAASKATKFVTRRTMVAAVRLSGGAAWVPPRVIALLFCGGIGALIFFNVEPGRRLSVFRQWAVQWLFAVTLVELGWCYIRWQLWRRVSARLGDRGLGWWTAPSTGAADKRL
mmetsp:Transcript_16430/g.52550  ORF Transcript_16430/g.52550 Transcript_16430/m.52550 type:complete len:268 (-) Transcript_16430:17-820(-)